MCVSMYVEVANNQLAGLMNHDAVEDAFIYVLMVACKLGACTLGPPALVFCCTGACTFEDGGFIL